MGTFQSKKKYDVATGESTIKSGSESSRSDRKREHKSRISQVTLNKLSVQAEVDQNLNNDEDSNRATLLKSAKNHSDVESELKHSENESNSNDFLADTNNEEKPEVLINKNNLHIDIDKQPEEDSAKSNVSNTLALENAPESNQAHFTTSRDAHDDKKYLNEVNESDTKLVDALSKSGNKDERVLPTKEDLKTSLVEEWLTENQAHQEKNSAIEDGPKISQVMQDVAEGHVQDIKHEEVVFKAPQVDEQTVVTTVQDATHKYDSSEVSRLDEHTVGTAAKHEEAIKASQVGEQVADSILQEVEHEKPASKVPLADELVADGIVQSAKVKEALKEPEGSEHRDHDIVQDVIHEQVLSKAPQELTQVADDIAQGEKHKDALNTSQEDEHTANRLAQGEKHEEASHVSENVADGIVQRHEKGFKESHKDERVTSDFVHDVKHVDTCENTRHVVFGSESDTKGTTYTCVKRDYSINQAFINEERKIALESVGRTKCEDNEQEAITVLNNAIKEAVGNSSHHIPEVVNESYPLEPSRKRPIIGDHPSVEEISDSIEKRVEEGVRPHTNESQTVGGQSSPKEEISIVKEEVHGIIHNSDPQCTITKEKTVVSHIYLENFGSDDVHYTLDKLQVMEGQIKSTRTRILSIKEID